MPRVKGSLISGVVVIDKKRMDKGLNSEKVQIPEGLTKEEKKEFIKKVGKENANDL